MRAVGSGASFYVVGQNNKYYYTTNDGATFSARTHTTTSSPAQERRVFYNPAVPDVYIVWSPSGETDCAVIRDYSTATINTTSSPSYSFSSQIQLSAPVYIFNTQYAFVAGYVDNSYSLVQFDYSNNTTTSIYTNEETETFAGSKQIRAFYAFDLSSIILLTYDGKMRYTRNAGAYWTTGLIADYGITSSLYNNITTTNNDSTTFNILGQGVYQFDNLLTDYTAGEWIQLESDAFKQGVNSYSVVAPTANVRTPTSWYFLGSRDAIVWDTLQSVAQETLSVGEDRNFAIGPSNYKYYRLLMTGTTGGASSVNLGEFRILYTEYGPTGQTGSTGPTGPSDTGSTGHLGATGFTGRTGQTGTTGTTGATGFTGWTGRTGQTGRTDRP
jgi:hypothetical protein